MCVLRLPLLLGFQSNKLIAQKHKCNAETETKAKERCIYECGFELCKCNKNKYVNKVPAR